MADQPSAIDATDEAGNTADRDNGAAAPDRPDRHGLTVTSFDGAQLHVTETGAPGAPLTVVLAHGWTLNSGSWRRVAAELAARGDVRVLAYDQRGHGRSGRGAEWSAGIDHPVFGVGPSVDQLGRDLEAVLDTLAPAGPVVLAGHSMGGMTIMALAARRPDLFGPRVVGVVLANTSSGGLDRLSFGFPQFLAAPVRKRLIGLMKRIAAAPEKADRFRDRQRTDTRLAVAQTRYLLFGKTASREVVVEANEIMKACASATLAGFFPGLLGHEKTESLRNLAGTRVQIIVGDRDKLTPPSHARRLERGIPGAKLTVVQGSGHMTLMEQPTPVVSALSAVIEDAGADLRS
jgi:pimeloyl-ACP methyl ester carboxylesterase